VDSLAAERAQFTERLITVLLSQGWTSASPIKLAQQFNLHAKNSSVSSHAVQRWLTGGAIPTQDRLVVLASLLEVTPGWLRFGGPTPDRESSRSDPSTLSLRGDLALLNRSQRKMVDELMSILLTSVNPTNRDN
jgi:hypothetical protein